MSAQLDQPLRLQRSASSLPLLCWPVGLAGVVMLALLLPIPGSPVALAGLVGVVGTMALFARHWLIVLLPVTAVLGPHFLPLEAMGVNVFGFRLLIMLLAVFSTPLTTRGGWWFNPVARCAVLFLSFWLLWALLSLFWSPDFGGGLVDVVTIVFGLGLLLVLLSLEAYKSGHLDKLRFGWLLGLILVAVGALLEIVRGHPLPEDPSFQIVESSVALGEAGFGPAIRSTLGFPSNFGGFLLLTVPFVLWSLERAKGPAKLFHLGLLAMVAVLVLYSASRIALIGLVLLLGFYGVVLQRRWYMPLVMAAAALVAVVAFSIWFVDSDLRLAQKLEKAERAGGADSSVSHRMALTLNGLWMVYNTAGRGIGAAGFEEEISGDVPIQLPIRRITHWNAHNFWVEVMSEYGVLTFGAFMALLVWIGLIGWRAQRGPPRRQDAESARVGRAIVLGLVAYVFYGVAGGSAMPHAVHWMFFATLPIMAAYLYQQRRLASTRSGRGADVGLRSETAGSIELREQVPAKARDLR